MGNDWLFRVFFSSISMYRHLYSKEVEEESKNIFQFLFCLTSFSVQPSTI